MHHPCVCCCASVALSLLLVVLSQRMPFSLPKHSTCVSSRLLPRPHPPSPTLSPLHSLLSLPPSSPSLPPTHLHASPHHAAVLCAERPHDAAGHAELVPLASPEGGGIEGVGVADPTPLPQLVPDVVLGGSAPAAAATAAAAAPPLQSQRVPPLQGGAAALTTSAPCALCACVCVRVCARVCGGAIGDERAGSRRASAG
jgi:hypothetical protein